MRRRFLAAALGLAAALPAAQPRAQQAQQAPVGIQFWHGLAQPLGGLLEGIVADFNRSQPRYRVVPSFRGSYPETMVAAIAAFRASTAPHVVQMFEVGTGTMMAAGRAVKPVHELLRETGVEIDFGDYLAPVRSYYATSDGRQMAMPFNSSTAVVFYSKDAFRRAGLDPERFPETWPEVAEAARRLKAAGVGCPMSTAWPTWIQIEQFSAIHDVPLATQANGFNGLNAELRINNPVQVRHVRNLADWQREGLFRYGGRDAAGDALFPSGECAILFASSGLRARVVREARFDWGVAMLPYYPDVAGAPINSIIGGAAFWAMNRGPNQGRSAEEWRAVAEFFRYLARPEVAARWHTETGFLPVTRTAYEQVRASGYYERNPGADIPIRQLLRGGGQTTENSRGIRLGGFVEIRNIIQEEMEKAFQGQQDAQQAMDNAVARGNQVLRAFERQNRGG
ncbi:sn-glycerol-3-phosphate ABC transporter substrate-binding protein UgpB [Caldovatus aquaticus]|uniref:sn-glycerol-3-phosphate-binding periplasmic protein UgpB n=1 Tax=Caldovatus aquaticus TaxID=2865671 RepID=A0ABS7F1W7_9PROT|nr:sn-glycerol-3-phosphate ABC transporter substrate-binding protein UgpB [Caldovatus aquaticus]MBW8268765.1 sn-glycerol-3-phosphate ABC transporter substrate-binding protein UgpB [Caldovatus aquaticus]